MRLITNNCGGAQARAWVVVISRLWAVLVLLGPLFNSIYTPAPFQCCLWDIPSQSWLRERSAWSAGSVTLSEHRIQQTWTPHMFICGFVSRITCIITTPVMNCELKTAIVDKIKEIPRECALVY